MRLLFAAMVLAVSACAAPEAPPVIYPEAELAPGQILAPIRAAMGQQIAFTNSRLVSEDVQEVEGYRADGAYKFTVSLVDGRWLLTRMERVGPAPTLP
jgi:hypothetical protein